MAKPTYACPKHMFPLGSPRDACPICREEVEDETGEYDSSLDVVDNGCPECGGTGEAPDNGTNMGECDECCGLGTID